MPIDFAAIRSRCVSIKALAGSGSLPSDRSTPPADHRSCLDRCNSPGACRSTAARAHRRSNRSAARPHVQVDFGGGRERRARSGSLPFFSERTASLSMSEYSWKPISCISPDWLSPSTSPAPRIPGRAWPGKSRCEFFHLLDRIQAALRQFGQALHVMHQQIGVGLVMRTADPARN